MKEVKKGRENEKMENERKKKFSMMEKLVMLVCCVRITSYIQERG